MDGILIQQGRNVFSVQKEVSLLPIVAAVLHAALDITHQMTVWEHVYLVLLEHIAQEMEIILALLVRQEHTKKTKVKLLAMIVQRELMVILPV